MFVISYSGHCNRRTSYFIISRAIAYASTHSEAVVLRELRKTIADADNIQFINETHAEVRNETKGLATTQDNRRSDGEAAEAAWLLKAEGRHPDEGLNERQ